MSKIVLNQVSTAPSAPAANKIIIYQGTDGFLYRINAASVVTRLDIQLSDITKVAVDSAAAEDYIGATGSDGVLRINGTYLNYTDGGDFITIDLAATVKTQLGYIDQDVTSGSSPTLDGANITGIVSGKADVIQISARKDSAGTIAAGRPVYISDYDAGNSVVLVEEADSSNPAKMPAVGVVETALDDLSNGFVIIGGNLVGIDTTAYTVGAELYVSNLAALTSTKPTGTDKIQKVGVVERVHATLGEVVVIGAGRVNDVPNLPSANFWVGNASGVATEVTMSGDVTLDNAGAATIESNAVANTQLDDMTGNTVKCRAAATTGDPSDLSIAEDTVLGRLTGGNVTDLTVTQLKTLFTYLQGDITQEIISDSSTSRTPTDTDHGRIIQMTNASDITITFNTGLRSDFQAVYVPTGSGQITFAAGVSVTLNNIDSFFKSEEDGAFINVVHFGSNVYWIDGRLVP